VVDPIRPKAQPSTRRKLGPAAGPAASRTIWSLSEQETYELGRSLGRQLRGGELLLLEGELGLGKTVFTRGLAVGLGIPEEEVSSPSFTLVQEYEGGRVPVFHVDLYRLDLEGEVGTLGIEEILTAGGVVVVEWGDKLPRHLRRGGLVIRFHDQGEGARRIEMFPEESETRSNDDA
jgi:tRNA threonylcarbamoyladenosine biosynthesis protein TsaE